MKLNEKWELHALLIFHKNVMASHPQAENIEQALIQALNVDEESNIQCSVDLELFKSYFREALGQ